MSPANAGPASASEEIAAALAGLLDDPIVLVDIGCRWGFADAWTRIGDNCIAVGFEPDEEECERLRARYRDIPSVQVVAKALGAAAGTATLYVTEDPACSSLYRPSRAFAERHPRVDKQRLAREEQIQLIALDDWCAGAGLDRVDIVKLDTQGSELDVLRGAEGVLDSVRIVQSEVEFNPTYEGQPLFGDLDRFLRDRGFVLWRLERLAHYKRWDSRAGLQPASQFYDLDISSFTSHHGQLFWGEAVFVKQDLADSQFSGDWQEAVRGGCIAAATNLDDLAGFALEVAKKLAPPRSVRALGDVLALLPFPSADGEASALVAKRSAETEAAPEPDPNPVLEGRFVLPLGRAFAGAGWREPWWFESGPGRWMGPEGRAWADLPMVLPPGTRVELVVTWTARPETVSTVAVDVNGWSVPLHWVAHGTVQLGCGELPLDYTSRRAYTRVTVETPEPARLTETPDPRRWGVAVSEMRFLAPGTGRP